MYLLKTDFEVSTVSYSSSFPPGIYGWSVKRTGHKSKWKKLGSIIYRTDQEIEVNKIFIIYLSSNGGRRFQLKQTF